MKNGSYGQLADLQTKKFKNILAEELKCSGKQIPETKTNTTHWAFFRKSFGETKSIEQDLWPVITKHLSNSALSPVLVSPVSYYLVPCCLVSNFSCLCNLPRVSIDHCLFVCKTSANGTPDFNPNRLGNMASCCCCCHESHKILQSQQLLFSPSCLSVNPEKVCLKEAGPTSLICDITVWKVWCGRLHSEGGDIMRPAWKNICMFYIQTFLMRKRWTVPF